MPRKRRNRRKKRAIVRDVAAVEEILEKQYEAKKDQQIEETIQAQPDENLFVVDKLPGKKSKQQLLPSLQPNTEPKSKRQKYREKKLMSDKIINGFQGKPIIKQPTKQIIRPNSKDKVEYYRYKMIHEGEQFEDKSRSRPEKIVDTDLWKDEEPTKSKRQLREESLIDEWIEPALQKKKKVPEGFYKRLKPSPLDAVQIEAGTSYNPSYEDHQDLLGEAVAEELKREEERKKVNKALRRERRRKAKKRKRERLEQEAKQAAEEQNSSSSSESSSDDEASASKEYISNSFSKKLTTSERNRIKRRKLEVRKERSKLRKERREKRFNEIDDIIQELDQKDEEQKKRLEERARIKKEKEERPKKLSRHMFVKDPKAVLLTEELPEDLRTAPVLGNVWRERFQNLQERNILETRVLVQRRPDRYEKRSYARHGDKMPWEKGPSPLDKKNNRKYYF
eukprot:CAMPEP_0174253250 /NCGR_PEP_ID=MMETSP0439-20130205/2616_1 /TAXON_ID=0 /ORGANISM="Stereomyxa ramosa, Strain Chinc5" /LENGTH=450 /DNA_ID=CAMNT_0015334175 /DNA_START=19 /DNA_END=1371 /DNA_ORIENTATION=+